LLIEVTYSCDCGHRSLHPLITAADSVDSADSRYDAVLLQQQINAHSNIDRSQVSRSELTGCDVITHNSDKKPVQFDLI